MPQLPFLVTIFSLSMSLVGCSMEDDSDGELDMENPGSSELPPVQQVIGYGEFGYATPNLGRDMDLFDAGLPDPAGRRQHFKQLVPPQGVSKMRVIVVREDVETKPNYVPDLAGQLQTVIKNGYKPYITFEQHGWNDASSAELYGAALVKLYMELRDAGAEVTEWSALNEPDIANNTVRPPRPQIPADVAARFYASAANQLGAVCPHCTLAAGELAYSSHSSGYLYVYQAALEALKVSPKVWSMHAYHDVTDDDTHRVAEYADILANTDWTDFRIWVTETGTLLKGSDVLAGNEEKQRRAAERFLKLAKDVPEVERVYYYEFQASGNATHPWDSALLDREAKPRPAFCVLADLSKDECTGSLVGAVPYWESLGGDALAAPAASSWASERLDIFAIGTDNALWHKWYQSSTNWSDWEPLGGGRLRSAPSAVSWGPDRIDVFVRGEDEAVWHIAWGIYGWTPWESLGGKTDAAPAVASWAEGRLDVFIRGLDEAIWHKSYADGWSNWESLGGAATSAPAAVSTEANWIHVFTRGTDNQIWLKVWYGVGWTEWEKLEGRAYSPPAVSSWGPGRIDLFVRGKDDEIRHNAYESAQWSGWESLGGKVNTGPAAVSWGPNRIDLFTRGTDNAIWHAWHVEQGWY